MISANTLQIRPQDFKFLSAKRPPLFRNFKLPQIQNLMFPINSKNHSVPPYLHRTDLSMTNLKEGTNLLTGNSLQMLNIDRWRERPLLTANGSSDCVDLPSSTTTTKMTKNSHLSLFKNVTTFYQKAKRNQSPSSEFRQTGKLHLRFISLWATLLCKHNERYSLRLTIW